MPRTSLVALYPLAFAIAACGTGVPGRSDVIGLNGSVVHENGAPVPSAIVTFMQPEALDLEAARLRTQAVTVFQTTTDTQGRYQYPGAPAGTYNIFIQKGALSAAVMNTPVNAGVINKAAPATLSATGSVGGSVTLAGAPSSEGVEVFLAGTPYRAHADAHGQYRLLNVAAGTYRLVAHAIGYVKLSTSITVTPGSVTPRALSLNKVTVPAPNVTGTSPGVLLRGNILTITGTNFGSSRGTSVVNVGGYDVEQYLSWSDTEIRVRPHGFTPLGSAVVTVAVGNQQSDATTVQIVTPAVQPLAGGGYHSVAVTAAGRVAAWGATGTASNVPAGLSDVAAVAAGSFHNLAVKRDGTVFAWGDNSSGQSSVPTGLANVTAVAAGRAHSLALTSDGSVTAWGLNNAGQSNVPAGLANVVAVAAGRTHSLALKRDGTVVAWGGNNAGQSNVPADLSNVVAIAAGEDHNLAVKSDGTVVAWGGNANGQSNVPAGLSNVVAVAGRWHSLALKRDGTVVAWGQNSDGQANIPAGLSNVAAIAAGYYHTLALKRDGTVIAWGQNSDGQANIPAGLSGLVP